MKILALNPHHSGSHRAFLEGWEEHSRHEFDVLTLPGYKWKWRMRHAAVTFADQLNSRTSSETGWDALFCTDMLNLAEFRGLCSISVRKLPAVVYFHENQATYPDRNEEPRDLHYAFTNITTALAADRVWFNSSFHRDEFLDAADEWMQRMPDYRLTEAAEQIRARSDVHYPGILPAARRSSRQRGPLRIVWVSRWEHDKDPETFFDALRLLKEYGQPFEVSVLGESFGRVPDCFERAETDLAEHIRHWGYLPSREEYNETLAETDVVVSTARHEFFGIGMVEAVAAGCFPLAPRRLAYPEVLGDDAAYFHDGTSKGLARRLAELIEECEQAGALCQHRRLAEQVATKYAWAAVARRMDEAIESLSQ